jgi:hypothetical protein
MTPWARQVPVTRPAQTYTLHYYHLHRVRIVASKVKMGGGRSGTSNGDMVQLLDMTFRCGLGLGRQIHNLVTAPQHRRY